MVRRVLHLSLHADPLGSYHQGPVGGQQVLIRHLARDIQREGWGVEVLTLRQDPRWPVTSSFGPLGQITRLAAESRLTSEAEWLAARDALARQVVDWLKTQQRVPAVLHSHFWLSGAVAERVHQWTGIPWIHSPHKLQQWVARPGDPVSAPRDEIEPQLMRNADAVVVAYLNEADQVHRAAPNTPVYVVPPGIEPTEFFSRDPGPILKKLGLSRRPVMYVGRLNGRGLPDALAQLGNRPLPEDFHVVVIGGATDASTAWPLNLAPGLQSRVTFLGALPHRAVAPYLAAAACLVAPNQGPTLGVAVLEALASAVPVVGSRVPGVQDWVESGTDGYLVDRRDLSRLWDYAMDLWAHPERARQMGYAGQAKVHRHYTATQMAKELAAIYREVTGLGEHQAGVGY